MNRSEIFVFKPLSTGIGLERAHELRNAPGLWSGTRSRAAQAVRAVRNVPAGTAKIAQPPHGLLSSRMMMWQRMVAIWCDLLFFAVVMMLAIVCAGFFAAVLDQVPGSVADLVGVVTSFVWLRQSMQIVVAAVNLSTALPWVPVATIALFFACYRVVTVAVSGISPGTLLARWLVR